MTTTYTNLLRLAKQGTGDNNNTWGTVLNDNVFEMLEEAIAEVISISLTVGTGNYTLSTANAATDEARCAVLKFTCSPSVDRTVVVPATDKVYIIHNALSVAQSVTISCGVGGTVTFAQNKLGIVYVDSAGVYHVNTIPASSITSTEIADNAITNAKLADNAVNTVEITNDAVTFDKLQNIATSRILGRTTAGSGNVEELTVGTGLTLSGGSLTNSQTQIVVGREYAEYTANTAITTPYMVWDDSKPRNDEGTQILSVTRTPASVTNRFRVRFTGMCGGDNNTGQMIAAVYVNSEVECRAATAVWNVTTNQPQNMSIEFEFVPGSVSAQTISVRVGPISGGTMRMNGSSTQRYLGGASIASLVVEEIYST